MERPNGFERNDRTPSAEWAVLALTKAESVSFWIIVFASAFGALVTFGLYRWELRNIKTCNWLIAQACIIEREWVRSNQTAATQYCNQWRAPRLWCSHWGKTQAEEMIYTVTLCGWVMLSFLWQGSGAGHPGSNPPERWWWLLGGIGLTFLVGAFVLWTSRDVGDEERRKACSSADQTISLPD